MSSEGWSSDVGRGGPVGRFAKRSLSVGPGQPVPAIAGPGGFLKPLHPLPPGPGGGSPACQLGKDAEPTCRVAVWLAAGVHPDGTQKLGENEQIPRAGIFQQILEHFSTFS